MVGSAAASRPHGRSPRLLKLIPMLRESWRQRGRGGKVVKLRRGEAPPWLEQDSEQAAADIISKLGKKK